MKSISILILIIQMLSTMFVFPKNKGETNIKTPVEKKENAIVEKVEEENDKKEKENECENCIVPEITQEEKAPSEPEIQPEKPSDNQAAEEAKPIEEAKKEDTQKAPENVIIPENKSQNERVFELVNEERGKAGMNKLSYRGDLQNAADTRAREIVKAFSHTRPDGRSCFTVYADNGIKYRAAGENIAYGQRDANEVMNGWMNSQGHRANILSANYTGICVGMYEQNGIKYWVQLFIK